MSTYLFRTMSQQPKQKPPARPPSPETGGNPILYLIGIISLILMIFVGSGAAMDVLQGSQSIKETLKNGME